MAYDYPYGYNPYYQPRQDVTPQRQQNCITWVQGEGGAKAYPVAAGATVLLMDSETEVFYIKSTDQAGMPMPLRVFEYKERTAQQAPQYATRDELAALEQRIAVLVKEEAHA